MVNTVKMCLPQNLKRDMKRVIQNCRDSRCYHRLQSSVPSQGVRIIFVCKGNICRSAFAEHYLRSKKSNTFEIESCGLDVDQGNVPPHNAVLVAARFGVDLGGHRSKGLGASNVEDADLILAMEFWHYQRLVSLMPEKKDQIFLLRDFKPGCFGFFCNVFDPFGQSEKEFIKCFKLIQEILDRMCEQMSRTDT